MEPLREAATKDTDPVTRVVALGAPAIREHDVPGQISTLRKYLHHDEALVRMKACHAQVEERWSSPGGYGLEAAQVFLGHARCDVTRLYAERNKALAETIAAEMRTARIPVRRLVVSHTTETTIERTPMILLHLRDGADQPSLPVTAFAKDYLATAQLDLHPRAIRWLYPWAVELTGLEGRPCRWTADLIVVAAFPEVLHHLPLLEPTRG